MTNPQEQNQYSGWARSKDSVFDKAMRTTQTNPKISNKSLTNFEDTQASLNPYLANSLKPGLFNHEEKQENLSKEQIEKICYFDQNTQAYNYRYFMRKLKSEVSRSVRYQRWLTVFVIAIDKYFDIYEEVGFLGTEYLTNKICNTIINCARKDLDLIARFGDSRFILALPETEPENAMQVASRIMNTFEKIDFQYQWFKTKISVSVGVSFYPGHAHTAVELVALADIMCDHVGMLGGGGVLVCPD